jgi:hypothetical protein
MIQLSHQRESIGKWRSGEFCPVVSADLTFLHRIKRLRDFEQQLSGTGRCHTAFPIP